VPSVSTPLTPFLTLPEKLAVAASATPARPNDAVSADAINSSFFHNYSF
jgi:hypothetical protein